MNDCSTTRPGAAKRFLPSWVTRVVACASLVALLAVAARAADADTSTPKKAAVSFAKAVQAGDMAGVKALATGTDKEYAMVQALSDTLKAAKEMNEAAVKKFGPDAGLPKELMMDFAAEFDSAEEKIDGDTATLVIKGKTDDKFPPTLKKSGDGWKMDLTNMTKDPNAAQMGTMLPMMTKAMNSVTKNIAADKYKNAQEVMQDLQAQMVAAAGGGAPPADPK